MSNSIDDIPELEARINEAEVKVCKLKVEYITRNGWVRADTHGISRWRKFNYTAFCAAEAYRVEKIIQSASPV